MPPLESVVEILKIAPRYLAAIGLFCGLILLAPDRLLDWLGVLDVAQNYRQWFGVAFLAAVALLVVHGAIEIGRVVRNRTRLQKKHERSLKRLHCLTEDEKQILRFYVATQKKTNKLRVDDGVVNGLVAAGLIYRAASQGHIIKGFDHNISEFAWEYLHEHPELLDGTTRTYRTDENRNRLFE